jgi:hypothetical protein
VSWPWVMQINTPEAAGSAVCRLQRGTTRHDSTRHDRAGRLPEGDGGARPLHSVQRVGTHRSVRAARSVSEVEVRRVTEQTPLPSASRMVTPRSCHHHGPGERIRAVSTRSKINRPLPLQLPRHDDTTINNKMGSRGFVGEGGEKA